MRGGVAELADAADLKSASSECGFESHRPYQGKDLIAPRRIACLAGHRRLRGTPQASWASRGTTCLAGHRVACSAAPASLPVAEPGIEEIELVWKL